MNLGMPFNEVRTVWAKVLSDKPNASVRTVDLNSGGLTTHTKPHNILLWTVVCFSFTAPFMRYKMPYKCELFEIKVKI
jgi:hypothetical protein